MIISLVSRITNSLLVKEIRIISIKLEYQGLFKINFVYISYYLRKKELLTLYRDFDYNYSLWQKFCDYLQPASVVSHVKRILAADRLCSRSPKIFLFARYRNIKISKFQELIIFIWRYAVSEWFNDVSERLKAFLFSLFFRTYFDVF